MGSVTREVLEHGTDGQREAMERLARRLRDADAALSAPDEPVEGLGPRPSAEAMASALARNEARLWDARRRLYAAALSYGVAAERLGVSEQQISNLVSAGDLVALDGPEGRRLPAWQFDPETRRGRLDGVRQVAEVFPGGLLSLSDWVVLPNPSLQGRSPAAALSKGDLRSVVAVAGTQR